jgi:hypothetical protein
MFMSSITHETVSPVPVIGRCLLFIAIRHETLESVAIQMRLFLKSTINPAKAAYNLADFLSHNNNNRHPSQE